MSSVHLPKRQAEGVSRKRGRVTGGATQAQAAINRRRLAKQRHCDHCDHSVHHYVWQSNGVLRLECWAHYAGPGKGGRR